MNNKAIALVTALVIVFILIVLGASVFSRSVAEKQLVQRYVEDTQAFWLAEAAINKALYTLRIQYNVSSVSGSLGRGGYSATIVQNANGSRTVAGRGFIPDTSPYRAERFIEAVVNKFEPPNFFENAIYTAGNVNISGQSYDINGNVRFGGTISDTSHIHNGAAIHDPTINPLALLSFSQLRAISIEQGNYHDANHLNGPFPTSFWHDQTAGIPNVVFLEGNFDLSGKNSVGGFYVVGGEVSYDATISGNVAVDGAIYTRGTFTINGGGSALNIDGGVWSTQTILHGGVDIHYNQTYMNAIKNLGIAYDVQIISWKDAQNPYLLVN